LRELTWVLTEQTDDEDARFNILEAASAEDSAQRAAWEAATRHDFAVDAPSTKFVHYRGEVAPEAWTSLLTAESPDTQLPTYTKDERGQGRVWAMLDGGCQLPGEDSATAGHTAAALLAMSRVVPQSRLDAIASWEKHGLIGWQPTHENGAEDRLAEALARGVLETLRTPALASELLRQPESAFDTPLWTLALTLATNGHPSWLTARSTPQSRALFDGGALEVATRRFAAGPLQLSVLTNHGPAQSSRLGARLAHLLSGVHTSTPECPTLDLGPNASPAGEYEIATTDVATAVALYVVDRRFALTVRRLAGALNRREGWLRHAVEPLGVRVTATGLGTPSTMAAIGFTVSAETREAMDAALSQLRVMVADLARAPAASLEAATGLKEPSSPAERLAGLSSSATGDSAAKTTGLNALLAEGLTERRLFIVRPFAPSKAANSSKPK
jgi:hypothetical protein